MAKVSPKITPFLWYDTQALEAAKFYCSIFKNSKILDESPLVVTFELEGQKIMALNGGPQFKLNESFSFFIECDSQQEVDEFWEKLSADAIKSQCGWVQDKFGLWWQVIPSILMKLVGDPDKKKAQRVMDAMLKMTKIEIKLLQQAYDQK
jgi:predicted 3-demethylubiquinone-9 3-methyltransferase (glyoxalase superfamily)